MRTGGLGVAGRFENRVLMVWGLVACRALRGAEIVVHACVALAVVVGTL